MNEYDVNIDFSKGRISTNLKELVQNDYNSTKLNFTFNKEGRVLFKLLRPDASQYVDEVKNNILIFGPGILSVGGKYNYEISLYSEDGRLTTYAVESFKVRKEKVNTDELVDPDDRVPVLDNLINEVNIIKRDVEEGKYNGKDGIDGVDGIDGKDGITPNIQIGTVTTLESDSEAQVIQTGTIENPIFNFAIPRGKDGATGPAGIDGKNGVSTEEVQKMIDEAIGTVLEGEY